MREEFKEFIKDCKKSILFYTFIYAILFIISKIIVNALGLEYMQYVYKFSIFAILLGIILGIVQIFVKSKSKGTRICITICIISIITLISISYKLILLFYVAYFPPEHRINKDGKEMVGYVYAFLNTRVEYYEYINPLIRKINRSFVEDYGKGGFDPIKDNTRKIKEIRYYNENNKVTNIINFSETSTINQENINKKPSNYNEIYIDNNEQKIEIIKQNNSDVILYEKKINDNIVIRVRNLGAILAQRSIIAVEKSTDGGKTYISQNGEGIQIHNGAEFVFLNENIGFINDPGLAGTDGENKGFLVTTDGGKTFKDANIIHPTSIEEKNLLVKGVPYIKDGELKVQIYTINHSKYPEKTYYEFTSNDNGITWRII